MKSKIAEQFAQVYGRAPEVVTRAPGRIDGAGVTLPGGHREGGLPWRGEHERERQALGDPVAEAESHQARDPLITYAPGHKLTNQFEALYDGLENRR